MQLATSTTPTALVQPFVPLATARPATNLIDRVWFAPLVLSVLCGSLFFYGLNIGQLYRTETLRAILAAEFLRSGDWIVPRLYGEPLFTKPPGMYAAIALASWPIGQVTEATARLPSVVAATITVILFYWYFRRQTGRLGGLVAAVILPLNIMWLDKAPSAEIDMLQVAWVAAAIIFLLRALEADEEGRRGWIWWMAALLCVAGGVLTKWTAPAFFYGTAIPLLWCRGRLRLLWGRQHLCSAAVGATICIGWAVLAVSRTGWEVFYNTVSREALMRLSPAHHDRPYPWLETLAHPLILFTTNLPWSVCLFWALRPRFARLWDERGRRLLQALHCWIWPNLLFWSSIPEHATRHSFPLCAGLTGMAAMVWIAWLDGRLAWPVRGIRPISVLVGMAVFWVGLKLVFLHGVVPSRNDTREPREKAAQVAAAIPESATLYLFRLKDEGIMFYYGRPVRRLHGIEHLPSSGEPLYCILEKSEWETYDQSRPAEAVLWLRDEQGAEIVLARFAALQSLDDGS
jgi:4-amino-4-deoxy-L-arabinose transferase-like glycosyltransferase